jgi:hypothetical protein
MKRLKSPLKCSFLILLSTIGICSFGQQQTPADNNKPVTHFFWKRGSHPQELALGNYIVVAQTTSEADAQKLIKELIKLDHPEPKYGYLTNTGLWYLVFDCKTDDFPEMHRIRDKYQQHKMFKAANCLTVHE